MATQAVGHIDQLIEAAVRRKAARRHSIDEKGLQIATNPHMCACGTYEATYSCPIALADDAVIPAAK